MLLPEERVGMPFACLGALAPSTSYVCFIFSFFSLLANLKDKYCYPYFTEEENEGQKKLPQGHTTPELEFEPGFVPSKVCILEFLASIKVEAC